MKKALNTNLEIYNYLNVVSRRLGRLYKYTGYNSLPADFDINEEKFKEILVLAQLRDDKIQPTFVTEDKRHFKKRLKTSLKRCSHILNHDLCRKYCDNAFAYYLEIYFDMRKELVLQILKTTNEHDFDEVSCWREIFNLNPILAELTESLYDDKFDYESLLLGLEKKYKQSYVEKIATLEKKQNKKRKKQHEIETLNRTKNAKNLQKNAKIEEKTAKNTQKTVKKQEIQQVRADIKKTTSSSKAKKSDRQI